MATPAKRNLVGKSKFIKRHSQLPQPGQTIKITHLIRVGSKTWPAVITGTFRHIDSLATGLATDRLPRDDIIVPIVHFTKENGEMSSVALDEHTKIEVMGSGPAG